MHRTTGKATRRTPARHRRCTRSSPRSTNSPATHTSGNSSVTWARRSHSRSDRGSSRSRRRCKSRRRPRHLQPAARAMSDLARMTGGFARDAAQRLAGMNTDTAGRPREHYAELAARIDDAFRDFSSSPEFDRARRSAIAAVLGLARTRSRRGIEHRPRPRTAAGVRTTAIRRLDAGGNHDGHARRQRNAPSIREQTRGPRLSAGGPRIHDRRPDLRSRRPAIGGTHPRGAWRRILAARLGPQR